ncbi:Proline-rich nuclear receptor coactivator [Dirofilaria immitis]
MNSHISSGNKIKYASGVISSACHQKSSAVTSTPIQYTCLYFTCRDCAPAGSNIFRSQLSSKNTSPVKSAFQKRPISLDVTPKRKTERKLTRRQQQLDIVNFAGAKFSESPEAKVVPLPPFIWCEEALSSLSSSADEQSGLEVMKIGMKQHEKFHNIPKWNKCSPSLQMTPLHCVAVLPTS